MKIADISSIQSCIHSSYTQTHLHHCNTRGRAREAQQRWEAPEPRTAIHQADVWDRVCKQQGPGYKSLQCNWTALSSDPEVTTTLLQVTQLGTASVSTQSFTSFPQAHWNNPNLGAVQYELCKHPSIPTGSWLQKLQERSLPWGMHSAVLTHFIASLSYQRRARHKSSNPPLSQYQPPLACFYPTIAVCTNSVTLHPVYHKTKATDRADCLSLPYCTQRASQAPRPEQQPPGNPAEHKSTLRSRVSQDACKLLEKLQNNRKEDSFTQQTQTTQLKTSSLVLLNLAPSIYQALGKGNRSVSETLLEFYISSPLVSPI